MRWPRDPFAALETDVEQLLEFMRALYEEGSVHRGAGLDRQAVELAEAAPR